MTTTRVDIIDRSVEKAHIWINDVAAELSTEDGHHAYRVLRAFRDHLTVDEAAKLAAQLPIFVRGVFYEGLGPQPDTRARPRHRQLPDRDRPRRGLAGETEASFAATAVSRVLQRHVSGGEGDNVLHALPPHLRELLGAEDR
jgi:uncharacterized protein (DUF2267 family)